MNQRQKKAQFGKPLWNGPMERRNNIIKVGRKVMIRENSRLARLNTYAWEAAGGRVGVVARGFDGLWDWVVRFPSPWGHQSFGFWAGDLRVVR